MDLSYLLAGIIFGFSSGIAPGPTLTLAISETINHGSGAGFKVACAPLFTDPPIILISWAILSRFDEINGFLGTVSLSGALFLLYLSYENFAVKPPQRMDAKTVSHAFKKGIVTNILNPAPYLFWVTVGTPVLHEAFGIGTLSGVAYLAGFYCFIVGAKVGVALLVARFRDFLRGRLYLVVIRTMGVFLLIFALLFFKNAGRYFGIW